MDSQKLSKKILEQVDCEKVLSEELSHYSLVPENQRSLALFMSPLLELTLIDALTTKLYQIEIVFYYLDLDQKFWAGIIDNLVLLWQDPTEVLKTLESIKKVASTISHDRVKRAIGVIESVSDTIKKPYNIKQLLFEFLIHLEHNDEEFYRICSFIEQFYIILNAKGYSWGLFPSAIFSKIASLSQKEQYLFFGQNFEILLYPPVFEALHEIKRSRKDVITDFVRPYVKAKELPMIIKTLSQSKSKYLPDVIDSLRVLVANLDSFKYCKIDSLFSFNYDPKKGLSKNRQNAINLVVELGIQDYDANFFLELNSLVNHENQQYLSEFGEYYRKLKNKGMKYITTFLEGLKRIQTNRKEKFEILLGARSKLAKTFIYRFYSLSLQEFKKVAECLILLDTDAETKGHKDFRHIDEILDNEESKKEFIEFCLNDDHQIVKEINLITKKLYYRYLYLKCYFRIPSSKRMEIFNYTKKFSWMALGFFGDSELHNVIEMFVRLYDDGHVEAMDQVNVKKTEHVSYTSDIVKAMIDSFYISKSIGRCSVFDKMNSLITQTEECKHEIDREYQKTYYPWKHILPALDFFSKVLPPKIIEELVDLWLSDLSIFRQVHLLSDRFYGSSKEYEISKIYPKLKPLILANIEECKIKWQDPDEVCKEFINKYGQDLGLNK